MKKVYSVEYRLFQGDTWEDYGSFGSEELAERQIARGLMVDVENGFFHAEYRILVTYVHSIDDFRGTV